MPLAGTRVAMFVGAAAPGPSLLRQVEDETTYFDDLDRLRIAVFDASLRPAWAPVEQAELAWALDCAYGITEGLALVDGLSDAWDGSYLSFGPDDVDFAGDGTLRTYDDGTLILTCPAATEPAGLAITRHLIVPGSSPGGRLVVDLIDVAVGVLPLVSTGLEVDFDRVGSGDQYPIGGRAGATLANRQRVAIAAIVSIRGGFSVDDGPGMDAAMQALGADLAPFAGGAVCAATPEKFFVGLVLVEHGPAIRSAICAGYAGL